MRRCFVLVLGIALVATGVAAEESPGLDPAAQEWRQRLADEHAALVAARERVVDAQIALGAARQHHHPRGDLLGRLYADLEAARDDLAKLETSWPQRLEEARRAGVPPVVLRDYEDPGS